MLRKFGYISHMKNSDKINQIDAYLLIAMFRCLNEQLYTLKGAQSGIIKMKFNRLLKVATQYENELIKNNIGNDSIDAIYDSLMDIMVQVKEQLVKTIGDE